MTDKDWLTVSEASEQVKIPVETIRRYIRAHSVHLKVKKLGKKYHIHDESMTVIRKIRALYELGRNVEEVEEALSEQGIAMTITVKNDSDEPMTVHVADELEKLNEAMEQQHTFNKLLLEKLERQNEYIGKLENEAKQRDEQQRLLVETQENRVSERDERLMKEFKEHQERIEQNMLERDERLMNVVRGLQEQKQALLESAATKNEEELKKGFWARLFG